MIFKCKCGKEIEFKSPTIGSYNVGDAQRSTGWTWLPAADGGEVWLCEFCGKRAASLAEELYKILGTTYAHIPSLLKNLPDER